MRLIRTAAVVAVAVAAVTVGLQTMARASAPNPGFAFTSVTDFDGQGKAAVLASPLLAGDCHMDGSVAVWKNPSPQFPNRTAVSWDYSTYTDHPNYRDQWHMTFTFFDDIGTPLLEVHWDSLMIPNNETVHWNARMDDDEFRRRSGPSASAPPCTTGSSASCGKVIADPAPSATAARPVRPAPMTISASSRR